MLAGGLDPYQRPEHVLLLSRRCLQSGLRIPRVFGYLQNTESFMDDGEVVAPLAEADGQLALNAPDFIGGLEAVD